MNQPKLHVLLLAILASLVLAPAALAQRETHNLNLDWRLHVGDPSRADARDFDDSAWKLVTLPRAWNEDDAFSKDIKDHSTGVAWYRKHFTLTAAQLDNTKIFIEFEGVRQAAEVYVNGKHVGRGENGIMAFGFDITGQLVAGENIIAVRTDNAWDYREKETNQRYQWADKNFNANYGGITKNVRLHITKKLYQTLPLYSNLKTTGVYIYAVDFDIKNRAATIHAESEVRNETGKSQAALYTMEIPALGVKVSAAAPVNIAPGETAVLKASARAKNIDFWSWGHGALYDVRTTISVAGKTVDTVTTRTGFRKTEYANGMITLNDRVIQMHGYAQRTSNEWPAIGASVPAWLSDFSNGLMVESGGNLVRWMHITPWKQDVESCDRVGLIQAMPAGDSERDVTGRRWEQRVEVMRDAIIYNRNNPSILFYESGNNGVSEAHMIEMRALRDKYDPHGGRASGSRDMLNSKIAEYGGHMLYINKSARIPFWQMEYSRDEGLRKYWDDYSPPYHKDGDGPLYRNAPAAVYNRNQDSHAIENIVRWYDYWRERPGTGRRVNSGGTNIIFSDSNTHHRGSENYRRSGEVDAMRIPKDGFHAHKVMWDAWVDIERPAAHIIGHWNYAPGTVKNICVVSSADAVELFLNGKSLGRGAQSHRFLYTFENIAWQPGELRAAGYDTAGKKVTEAVIQTAGEPAALRLKNIGKANYHADGHDLALVEFEVVDADGRRCPTALDLVEFELDGPAEWRGGIGHGRADNYILSKTLPVECGVNRVLIRTTRQPGAITLRARSGSLRSATLTLHSVEYPSHNGLAALQPAPEIALPDRGPTPAGLSYKISRTPVGVVSVRAGSNAADAAKSYDDDETTAWTSANDLAGAWIEYTLERPAKLDEITLRLTGWRQRSYPVSITLDGVEIHRDATPKSLGYVTLAVKPAVAGKVVRIELQGSSEARDAFTMSEVAAKENASTGADKIGGKTLSIGEVEFYEILK
ncbi:beta-galactosidase [Ereboglobus sp. PH5-5]|uniref:DUF4982 domain-containing protein n=1 Tax=Ereboglobus sp. PH5-5 TaxID=2940529 RepID=UPI0024050BAD|nr:DUF4982 domain-containing protein [Ereboglobus sp. PH5-5]MDF9833189.1 beta-galactosidase [Ereboglobus sp. PH5-5]